MKKAKILTTTIALALAGVGAVSVMSGCGKNDNPDEPEEKVYFSFSIGVKSGRSVLPLNEKNESIVIYDNGVDTAGRTYQFSSLDESIATISSDGKITPVKPGKVNFVVMETKSGYVKQLPLDLTITDEAADAKGGFNFANASTDEELDRRAEILSKLEKYTMDTHLTGITLFDNGGYVRYSDRIEFPGQQTNPEYVTGYGFGILTEGKLNGTLPGAELGKLYPTYYHSAIAQDSLKIDQYTATGSQVSDLASYITSSYWGTKLGTKPTEKKAAYTYYDWYPVLAADKVTLPKRDGDGKLVYIDNKLQFEGDKVDFNEPIPMEDKNNLGLYKKWRIYVKTDGDINGSVLKYHTNSPTLQSKNYDGRGVTKEDYEFIYKYLFTGSNSIVRGTEMANDSSYGVKGAQRYFNDTKNMTETVDINNKWKEYVDNDKLGLHVGQDDVNGAYIDIELINAIDPFTAMYTLSSSLVSPLPEDFFIGANSISGDKMQQSAKLYGKFNNGGDDAILDYTLCCGPYVLEKWDKNSQIVFKRNNDWFDYKKPDGTLTGRYNIEGVYNKVIDSSSDTEKNWKQFEAGNLDSAGVPSKKVKDWKDKDGVYATKGDSTFKLNVNSCTQEQWDYNFGPNGKIYQGATWQVKPWMSNSNFLNGLFFSINRKEFAENRGVTPSINYFSDAYMADPKEGKSYNDTKWHKEAVAGYETFDANGNSDYGYSKDKAIDCFRAAVKELSAQNKITLGTKKDPTEIKIHIKWMYATDVKEYGEDIKAYFESAFNNDAVCGGKVKLNVTQDAVTNWEEVYNEWMMKGQFDLGFGAISGNTYNPLNFMEVLKSDNSSSFTLNWGADTSKVDPINPIIYDDGNGAKAWSFDGLWEVADHGGIVENGVKIDPVKSCYSKRPTEYGSDTARTNDLYKGYRLTIPVEFADYGDGSVEFDFSHLDVYVFNRANITLSSDKAVYDKANKVIIIDIDETLAQEINQAIKDANNFKDEDITKPEDAWKKNPFTNDQLGKLFSYELYYSLKIADGAASENFYAVKNSAE